MASSGNRSIAKAHEQPSGFDYPWLLSAFAVCTDSPQYRTVPTTTENEERPGPGGVEFARAGVECPAVHDPTNPFRLVATRLVNVGGAVGNGSSQVMLHALLPVPYTAEGSVNVVARELIPTSRDWSLTAQAICVL